MYSLVQYLLNFKIILTEFSHLLIQIGETTNNRIESLNYHLKELGSYSDTLLQCYQSLMTSLEHFERQKAIKQHSEKFKLPLYSRSDIPEVMQYEPLINEIVTRKIGDYVLDQLNMAYEDLNFSFEQLNQETYKIGSDGHRDVETTIDNCSCFRYVNKELPCYHLFALRKHLNVALFQKSLIKQQFNKEVYFQNSALLSQVDKLKVKSPQAKQYNPMSTSKFLSARIETDRLANVISKAGQTTYRSQLAVVRELTQAFAEKKDVEIRAVRDSLCETSSDEAIEEVPPPVFQGISTSVLQSDTREAGPSQQLQPAIPSEIANIRPQLREKFVGRPSQTLTAIGKTRSRPKPSLRIRLNKHLVVKPISKSPSKKIKTVTPEIEVIIFSSFSC